MVNNESVSPNGKNDRLSMRHSLMVWVAGAILGWVVAVASVWTALNSTDNNNIAENSPSDAEKMEQISPAAGNKINKEHPKN